METSNQISLTSATSDERRDAGWDLAHGHKNYLGLVAAQVVSALLSFAAILLATRLLGSTGYGGVIAIVAASQAIGQLAVNWTVVSVSRYGIQEFVETGRIAKTFWTRFWIFLPNVLLVLATSALWLPMVFSLLKLPSQAYLFVLSHFLANAIWIHVQQGLQGAKLMRPQGNLLALERVLILLIISAYAVLGQASFLTVALAYILSPLLAAVVGLWVLRKLIFPVVGLDRPLFRKMMRFSMPLLPASLIGYMSTNYFDAFFITNYLSATDLGVYAVAYQISGNALQLPLLVGTVIMPLFVTLHLGGEDERVKRFFHNVLPLFTLAWGVGCALVAVIGGWFFPLVFGAQFRGIAELLWPLMAASALAGPVLMGYAPMATAKSATYLYTLSAASAALVNIVLNYLLIPRYGLLGCAWATTAAYTVNVLLFMSFVDLKLLLTRTWTLQAILPALIGAGCASWFNKTFLAGLIALIATGLLASVHRRSLIQGVTTLKSYRRLNRDQQVVPVEVS